VPYSNDATVNQYVDEYLQQSGWDGQDVKLAITHLISRAVYPAS
jgi:hypothetical protein